MKVRAKCVGCGQCFEVCKFDAITVYGKAYIDREKCTKCGICHDICPPKFNAVVIKTGILEEEAVS